MRHKSVQLYTEHVGNEMTESGRKRLNSLLTLDFSKTLYSSYPNLQALPIKCLTMRQWRENKQLLLSHLQLLPLLPYLYQTDGNT